MTKMPCFPGIRLILSERLVVMKMPSSRLLLALEHPAVPAELGAGAPADAALAQPVLVDGLSPYLGVEPAVLRPAVAALAALVHRPLLVLLDEPAHRATLPWR
jgi:hypothetical protein